MLATNTRILAWTAAGAVLITGLLVTPEEALARRNRKARVGEITELFDIFGAQGTAGAGTQVQLAFRLVDAKKRLHKLDTEYGWDRNGDGVIGLDEFLPATTNDRDPRATIRRLRVKKRKFAERYSSFPGRGAVHAVIWDSAADVGGASFLLEETLFDDDGRELRDPLSGAVATARGTGVQLRVRPRIGKRNRSKGGWVYSDPFEVDNRIAPELTLGAVVPGPTTLIEWTASSADSEDLNDNGVLDPGEDTDLDGSLDTVPVICAFDWVRLAPGQDPAVMTAAELADLGWQPCAPAAGGTRTADVGVNGHVETFAWNAAAQVPAGAAAYILRARALAAAPMNHPGEWVYMTAPFTLAP